jgi:iron complex transport system ATP-binding protein
MNVVDIRSDLEKVSSMPEQDEIQLRVSGVNVIRRKRQILKGVDLDLRTGEVLGLIGANGSGKSTLLKSILGFLPTESGRIEIQGRAIQDYTPTALARKVAYLAQENECRWPLTVARIVALGRMPHQTAWQSLTDKDWEIVQQAMQTVEVEYLAHRIITRLSGGERRRVLFARALASEPDILFADEPTAGLDPFHQLHLMELLRKLSRMGKSVVVVLHDLTHASRFCDRLVLLKEGEVLASGNASEVLSSEHLEAAYSIKTVLFKNGCDEAVVPWNCCCGISGQSTMESFENG